MSNIFCGEAKPRSQNIIQNAARSIDVEYAAFAALLQVETGGKGFDSQRRPKALFEPHKFHAAIKGDKALLAAAVGAGLAYPKAGSKPYPKDSYARITAATALHRDHALASTSWGLPQIMGHNYKQAGYNSPLDMVRDFCRGEDEQIMALARFLKATNIDVPLREKDWTKVARLYNGSAYAKNNYANKLAEAYASFVKKTEDAMTETTPNVAPEPIISLITDIKNAQKKLTSLGYTPGAVDGKFGPMTRSALVAFLADRQAQGRPDIAIDTQLTKRAFIEIMHATLPRQLAPERQTASVKDLLDRSRIVKWTRDSKWLSAAIGIPGAAWALITGILSQFPETLSLMAPAQAALAWVPGWIWGIMVAGVAAGTWYYSDKVQAARVEMHRNGETN